jgi:hypothetical protein
MADNKKTELIIYKTADGKAKIDVRMQGETLWLTQAQMSELFGRSVSVISRQIKNIFAEGELDEKSNLQNIQILNSDNPSGYVKTTSSVIAGLTRFALRCSASVIAGLTRFVLRCSASVIAGLTRNPIYGGTLA